ncbi:MAG: steroid C27-monooxygenase, partial [Actinobacteria bacterium]|nr:steroid C27-monooxygenase [Actinomycetota bacterium]NIU20854.1 steroid C27-monooxygenase [Actinomycetota bacterium]NIU68774.1 steroid C27-monooxygenase [Actinomycetota bacterium]NIV57357.1 steroid C27-monooxygenase [Actinomycetota bacterium]NIV88871.1 steroid C27-monooxygenase [Actinomycetota bacterium]
MNRHPEVFSSNKGGTQMQEPAENDEMDQFQRDALMLSMDPPKHTRYRRIVSRGFTPRMINLLEDYLQNRTD